MGAMCGQIVLSLVTVLTLVTCPHIYAQNANSEYHVQVLHDTYASSDWRADFDSELIRFFSKQEVNGSAVAVSIDYTGVKYISSGERPDFLINSLKGKHAIYPVDIVVPVLEPSVNFIEEFGEEIYPGVPRAYFLSQPPQDNSIEYPYTNSDMELSIGRTIDLIVKLLPDINGIDLISGNGSWGMRYLDTAERIIERQNFNGVSIDFLTNVTHDELLDRVSSSPENHAFIMFTFERDVDGVTYFSPTVTEEVSRVSASPVFGVFDSMLARGVLGGYMASAPLAAQEIGKLSLATLNDEPNPGPAFPYAYIFDGGQLDRWNIDRSLLPEGSTILNDPPSLWRDYRPQILGGASALLVQAYLILALVLSMRRHRLNEDKLEEQGKNIAMQKNLLESLINSIPDAILISDPDFTIHSANKSVAQVFGYEIEQIIGKKLESLASADGGNLDIFRENLNSQRADIVDPKVYLFRKADGGTFKGDTLTTAITSTNGEILGHYAVVRDVTERLSREQEHQQAQKMEALGNLVGGITHDFNNVLGVIRAHAELVMLKNEFNDCKNLTRIIEATKRGSELCDQIMTFSRDMSVEQRYLEMNQAVLDSVKLLRATIPAQIELTYDVPDSEIRLLGNFTQLQQVIMNLVNNSCQAIGGAAGAIHVSLQECATTEIKNFSLGVVEPGNWAVLKVSDNGEGIHDKDFDKVFEPFFTTKQDTGTGMGLAMVFKIVRSHGGVIDLVSSPGTGTQISIWFPLCYESVESEMQEVEPTLVAGDGQRILLVDDEVELLSSLDKLLKTLGYEVDAYGDAYQALHKFEANSQNYDLVISDQTMPNLNGLGLAKLLKKVRADVPVILCTGYSDLLDRDNEDLENVSSVMRKPFSAAELSNSIVRAVSAQS